MVDAGVAAGVSGVRTSGVSGGTAWTGILAGTAGLSWISVGVVGGVSGVATGTGGAEGTAWDVTMAAMAGPSKDCMAFGGGGVMGTSSASLAEEASLGGGCGGAFGFETLRARVSSAEGVSGVFLSVGTGAS